MLNEGGAVVPEILNVIDYEQKLLGDAMQNGQVNTSDDMLLKNIAYSIRQGFPQIRPAPPKTERVCIVGSGPSLDETFEELRELYFEGAHIVTLNGAYQWCLEHNIRPSTQIVLDARPSNARFVFPPVPRCRYVIASQCAPEVWDAVAGREHVWIFHASAGSTGPIKDLLDAFYQGNWFGIGGGVTVVSRAITLLRLVGYLRMDLFGIDCCWLQRWRLVHSDGHFMKLGGQVMEWGSKELALRHLEGTGENGWEAKAGYQHHAFAQPENEKDQHFTMTISPSQDGTIPGETFRVSPWHCKQLDDLVSLVKINGEDFVLNVHGRGLFAKSLLMLGSNSEG